MSTAAQRHPMTGRPGIATGPRLAFFRCQRWYCGGQDEPLKLIPCVTGTVPVRQVRCKHCGDWLTATPRIDWSNDE